MNDRERVDLSPLDPARDPERWARFAALTRLRIEAALAGASSPLDIVAVWFRPILAAAALLAAVLGSARLVLGSRSAPLEDATDARRLAVLSEQTLGRGERPTGAQLMVALRTRSVP